MRDQRFLIRFQWLRMPFSSQLGLCGRLPGRDGEPIVAPEVVAALGRILDYAARPLAAAPAKVLVLERGANVATTFGELGIPFKKAAAAGDAKPGDVLVLGPDANAGDLTQLVESGVKVLALALGWDETAKTFPASKATKRGWESYPVFNELVGKEPLLSGVTNADINWLRPSSVAYRASFDGDILTVKHAGKGVFAYSGIAPWCFDTKELTMRHNRRRAQALVTRLVANLGGAACDAFPGSGQPLYADKPIATDDPYRYFRW